MKKRNCYFYKVEGEFNKKQALKEISQIAGVISCEFDENNLIYEISPYANEYDILTASMSIIENLGGELIVGEENQYDSSEEILEEDFTSTDDENENLNEDTKLDENENIGNNRVIDEDLHEEKESLITKRKKLKSDVITRICELSVSLILLIISLILPNSENSVFSINSVLLIFSFAICIYEIFYYASIDISNKKFYSIDLGFSLANIALVLMGGLETSVILSLIYSFARSIDKLSERYGEIYLGEILDVSVNDEDGAYKLAQKQIKESKEKFGKNTKLEMILGYLSIAVTLLSLLTLIPALNLGNYSLLIISVAIFLIVLSQFVCGNIKANILSFTKMVAKYFEIEFSSFEQIEKTAKANSIEVDFSAMVNGEELKDDAIGCFMELKLLGIKNFHTNFDIDGKEEVKKNVDFVERELKNKKTISIGLQGRDINFNQGEVLLTSPEMFRLPIWYKIAKKSLKLVNLSKVLMIFACVAMVTSIVLTILKTFTLLPLMVYLIPLILVLGSVIGLLNFKQK